MTEDKAAAYENPELDMPFNDEGLSFEDTDFARHVMAQALDEMTPLQAMVLAAHLNGVELKDLAESRGVSPQALGYTWRLALKHVVEVGERCMKEMHAIE